jgi:hypothetical protein
MKGYSSQAPDHSRMIECQVSQRGLCPVSLSHANIMPEKGKWKICFNLKFVFGRQI